MSNQQEKDSSKESPEPPALETLHVKRNEAVLEEVLCSYSIR